MVVLMMAVLLLLLVRVACMAAAYGRTGRETRAVWARSERRLLTDQARQRRLGMGLRACLFGRSVVEMWRMV